MVLVPLPGMSILLGTLAAATKVGDWRDTPPHFTISAVIIVIGVCFLCVCCCRVVAYGVFVFPFDTTSYGLVFFAVLIPTRAFLHLEVCRCFPGTSSSCESATRRRLLLPWRNQRVVVGDLGSFCMGCVSSKQFKRADAEHEDSSILAKETTCKNPFLQSLCVFLGVHLLTWPSCSLCEWSGGPPWVVQEDKPFHIQRWPDPQGAVGFSMWSKSRNWPCDSQASNFCLSVFSCRRSSSLLSSGTVTRRTFSPIGSVPTLRDVSLSCRISIY